MERQSNPAVKWGLIFGAVLIVVELGNIGISYATGTLGTSQTSAGNASIAATFGRGCIAFLIEAAIYFTAGLLAARDNGRVGSGAVAGLIAGAMGSVVAAIVEIPLVMNMTFPVPANSTLSPDTFHNIVVVGVIVGSILGIGVGLGIGAGIAALGGLVGRSQFEKAHPPQQMAESYYQPTAPAPGYPQMPQPGYPPQQPMYPPAPQPDFPPQQPGYPPQQPPQYPPAQ